MDVTVSCICDVHEQLRHVNHGLCVTFKVGRALIVRLLCFYILYYKPWRTKHRAEMKAWFMIFPTSLHCLHTAFPRAPRHIVYRKPIRDAISQKTFLHAQGQCCGSYLIHIVSPKQGITPASRTISSGFVLLWWKSVNCKTIVTAASRHQHRKRNLHLHSCEHWHDRPDCRLP